MTPDERLQAVLTLIAAQLTDLCAEQTIKVYTLSSNRVAPMTVRRILNKKNHTIESLLDVADLANADVEVIIRKRAS